MATNAGLNIQIGANVQQLTAGLNTAANSVSNFGNSVNRLSPITASAAAGVTNLSQAVSRGQASFTATANSANNAANSLNNLSRRSGNTGQALTNLGRIVSDAPFGFIAIQNNIDPLIASLGGPAGLAIAVTVVGAALTTLAQKYGGLGNAINALNPLITAQQRAQKALNAALLEGGKSAQEEIVHVNTLYKASQNLNLPLSERSLIVDELQKKYPAYFGNLSKEAILAGKATSAYEDLKKSLLAAAQARAVEGALTKNAEALFELRQEIDKTNKKLAELRAPSSGFFDSDILAVGKKIEAQQNKLNGLRAKENALIAEGNVISDGFSKTVTKASDLGVNGVSDVVKVVQTLNKELKAVDDKSALFGLDTKKFSSEKLTALNKAFEDLSKINTEQARAEMKKIASQITTLEAVSDGFKSGEKISTVIKNLYAQLAAADAQFKGTGAALDVLTKDKIQTLQAAFEKLTNLGLKPTSPELVKIQKQIVALGDSIIGIKPIDSKILQDLGKNVRIEKAPNLSVKELADLLGIPNESSLQLDAKVTPRVIYNESPALIALSKFAKEFTDKNAKAARDAVTAFNREYSQIGSSLSGFLSPVIVDVQNTVASLLSTMVSATAEAIGNVITGKESLGQALSGILKILGQFIVDFGKGLVEAATLKIIATKSLVGGNPYLALAAGAAAIIAGTALKNKVPSFATGGVVTEPTLAMIGDNPGRKEAVIPSELWDKIGGGSGYIAVAELDYDKLRLRMEQARRRGGY